MPKPKKAAACNKQWQPGQFRYLFRLLDSPSQEAAGEMDRNIFLYFEKAARANRDRPAFLFEGSSISHGEVLDESLRIAAILSGLDVGAGDRVLVYSPNTPGYFSIFMGCARLGVILAPANVAFRSRELRHVLQNADPKIAFIDSTCLAEFASGARDCPAMPETVVVFGDRPDEMPDGNYRMIDDVRAGGQLPPPFACEPETPCLIVYTSGSTSDPKGVLHSHGSVGYAIETYRAIWDYRDSDIAVVSTPMSWVSGLVLTSAALLSAGATVALLSRFNPERVIESIETKRATMFFGTMSMYTKMLDVLRRRPADLSSLRFCMNGGEPCPESLVIPVENRFGLRLCQAWAFTENHPLVMMRPDDVDAPRGAAGLPAPGVEIRLLDDKGTEVPNGKAGEAWVRGPGAMTGYFGNPEMTSEKMDADGWIRTGDLLSRDAQGYLTVVGRASDMIIRSGANIAPAEVECALLEHDSIAETFVVGVPDRMSGEAVIALIVTVDGCVLSDRHIEDHLGARLARYKIPQLTIHLDAFPLTANGKVDRTALKARAVAAASGGHSPNSVKAKERLEAE